MSKFALPHLSMQAAQAAISIPSKDCLLGENNISELFCQARISLLTLLSNLNQWKYEEKRELLLYKREIDEFSPLSYRRLFQDLKIYLSRNGGVSIRFNRFCCFEFPSRWPYYRSLVFTFTLQ